MTEAPFIEQPLFNYFECKACGFDSIQPADFNGSETCPLCAGDSGHNVLMQRRTARDTDDPEGFDARKGSREKQEEEWIQKTALQMRWPKPKDH